MQFEFDLNSRTKETEMQINQQNETTREDRRDQRVDRQAAHQKQMIEQRKQSDSRTNKGETTKKFESSGNDILTGGANMEKFSR